MNIYEIAKKAGVSRSTVSRVINGEGYVSEEARQKVMRVIEEENYVPNPAARALVTKRSQVIGIVIPDTIKNILNTENSYYYSALLQGITAEAHLRDFATLLWVGHESEDRGVYHRRILKSQLMDGVLVVASVAGEDQLLRQLSDNKKPWVLIGRPVHEIESVSYVGIDNAAASEEAVRHLLSRGRRRIGTITGTMDNIDSRERLKGYKQALATANLPVDPDLIVEGCFSRNCGYDSMKILLERGVDAVFAASDLIAAGALQAIQDAGRRVPDDVALVGFDDLPIASQLKPALTTVRQSVAEKGEQATAILLNLIEGRIAPPVQTLLPTQLIVRESS